MTDRTQPQRVRRADARREAAAGLARLAGAALRYADTRIAEAVAAGGPGSAKLNRAKPGEFVADELAVMLRDQPYQVRCLLARSRRLAAGLPNVWEAFQRGDLDADQIRMIDRIARRVAEASTLAAIDEQTVDAAQTRSPKQLSVWLLRLVVQLEPLAFQERHRRALAERRVTVVQGADGIGYVTGEVSAADAAAIDSTLAAVARSLGADDPRTEHQRRADLFADLLVGRLAFDQPDHDNEGDETADGSDSLEVENIDPDTGELLGTHLQPIDADGEPIGEPVDTATHDPRNRAPRLVRRPQKHRVGVVLPLASLLGLNNTPGELADRSGFIPGEELKQLIADALDPDSRDQMLFTQFLTDDGGRLLNTTELSRRPSARLAQAIKIRAGTCRFPTCTVPAERCDLDHHEPAPRGPTSGTNMDPFLPKTPPGQNLRLACLRQRRLRRRLDHARRRTLPMHRRPLTDRTSRLNIDSGHGRGGSTPTTFVTTFGDRQADQSDQSLESCPNLLRPLPGRV